MAMASRNRLTFHRRIFLWLMVYSWLMVLCFALFQYYRERQFKAEELNIRLQAVNESLLERIGTRDTLPPLNETGAAKGLRVSVMDLEGHVIYDNSLDSPPEGNHLGREEIDKAMRTGSGYATRRHSASTGDTYFYSARRGEKYVVRVAVPYSVSLQEVLKADYSFLWFMVGVTLLMNIFGFFATHRIGQHVSRLNRFAEKAEQGERIFNTEPFPHDELGDISNHIVRLYARLQQVIADRDREHRLALHEEQEKIRIKKQLTNNINHELKTPVASMQACLETLIVHKDLPTEKREEFIERCYANCERLQRLLTDVSLMTRMDDGSHAITQEPVDLAAIIAEVCDEFKLAAEARGVEISNTAKGALPMSGNAPLLASIFRNLLDNALAYSGCSRIEISGAATLNDTIAVTVTDNGCGVPEEHLPRLFERFYRVDKGRSRQAGGTGLGLAIVKNAVMIHGGNISVANRCSGGLVFSFTLKTQPAV